MVWACGGVKSGEGMVAWPEEWRGMAALLAISWWCGLRSNGGVMIGWLPGDGQRPSNTQIWRRLAESTQEIGC